MRARASLPEKGCSASLGKVYHYGCVFKDRLHHLLPSGLGVKLLNLVGAVFSSVI